MNDVYEKARDLRLKGRSYNEIVRDLDVPKSTLWSWLKDLELPPKAVQRIKSRVAEGTLNGLVKRNRMQTVIAKERVQGIRCKASAEIGPLSARDRRLVGIALYWAEGYKRVKVHKGREVTNHPISFTNSDPDMVRAFMDFLRHSMGILDQDITAHIRLFPHTDQNAAVSYWCGITGLSAERFYESTTITSRASQGVRPYNRLPYGTIQVRVSRTDRFHGLMGWIEGLKQSLASGREKA